MVDPKTLYLSIVYRMHDGQDSRCTFVKMVKLEVEPRPSHGPSPREHTTNILASTFSGGLGRGGGYSGAENAALKGCYKSSPFRCLQLSAVTWPSPVPTIAHPVAPQLYRYTDFSLSNRT